MSTTLDHTPTNPTGPTGPAGTPSGDAAGVSPAGTTTAELLARFRPVFSRIAEGAVQRERERRLPFAEVAALKEAGFGALRVPVEYGGSGVSLRQLFLLLTELAAADSNLTQLWRGHFAYVEGRLLQPASAHRDRWLFDIGAGSMVGNASSELTGTSLRDIRTELSEAPDGALSLTGTKYYSTGSLYADWIAGSAVYDGERVSYAVRATAPGVDRIDDWDGFGQALTGSGTTHFEGARVDPRNVRPYAPEAPTHVPAFFQLVLVASLAGIARAAATDAADFVRPRTRSYITATTPLPREDPQVLQVVGEVSSLAFLAEAAVLAAADELDTAFHVLEGQRRSAGAYGGADATTGARTTRAGAHGRDRAGLAAVDVADVVVSQAQVGVVDLALRAATRLFEVGGASATSTDRALDRHWRNARTIASHNPAIYKARLAGYSAVHGHREPAQDNP
jgi:alkylation response protein AidB-like acyl-CoA dehydrogenase